MGRSCIALHKLIPGSIARVKIHLFILLLTSLNVLVSGQTKPYLHFTEDDGLPGNTVMDVVRDDNGFIWVATMNGIARFDGNRFIPVNDSNGNPLNMVRALAVADDNVIYAGTFGSGVAVITEDTVRKIFHAPEKRQDLIRKLYYSRYHKILLAGSDHGLFMLKDSSLIMIPFKESDSMKSEVLAFTELDSMIFFVVADEGLYSLTPDTAFPERSFTEKISRGLAFAALAFGEKAYTGYFDSVFTVTLKKPFRQEYLSGVDKEMFIWNFTPYREGKFYIGGLGDERFKGRAVLYDPVNKSYSPVADEHSPESVNSIFHDTISGVTWIARDNGLSAVFDSPFSYYNVDEGSTIRSTGFSGDTMFVLTGKGISYLSNGRMIQWLSNEQVMEKIHVHSRKLSSVPLVFDNKGYPDPVILVQNGKKLFVSSQRGAISIPDLNHYLPFAVGTFKVSLNSGSAYAFIQYDDLRFYPSLQDPLHWIYPDGPGGRVQDIAEILESGGAFYCISPVRGLFAIKDNKVFRLSEENSAIEDNLSDSDLDETGNFWCISARGKLFNVDFANSPFIVKRIDLTKLGISGNSFKWMKFHGSWLMIGTNKGVYTISRKELDSENPMISHFFNGNNGYDFISAGNPVTGRDGKLYVHNRNRIIAIDTTFMEIPDPVIYLSELHINGKDEQADYLIRRNLKYNSRQISFRFDAIKYPLSRNIQYRYRINKAAWITGNRIELNSLRPGRYEITMECINPENMSPSVRVLQFAVRPPLWSSVWFMALTVISIAVIVYLIMRARINSMKRQHEERTTLLKRNAELQLRSLQIQMNPHFIFNALNAIQGFIITKDTEESLTYLSKLAAIIRSNLENASEEYILLVDEISFLQKYISIEAMRFGDSLRMELRNNVSGNDVMLPPMLIQPLIENAIHYGMRDGRDGKIIISFDRTGELLTIMVEDNGPGMEATKNEDNTGHTGRALKIISQRLNILNQMNHTDVNRIDFIDVKEDGEVIGTRVVMRLGRK